MTLVWRPFRSAQAGSAALQQMPTPTSGSRVAGGCTGLGLRFGLWVYSGFRVRVLS